MALRTERQSVRMSKIKNGGLDQYGAEPFQQQQFGTAGVEGVKTTYECSLPSGLMPLRMTLLTTFVIIELKSCVHKLAKCINRIN